MVEQLIVDGSISASDMNVFSGINLLFGSEDTKLALYGDNGSSRGRRFHQFAEKHAYAGTQS